MRVAYLEDDWSGFRPLARGINGHAQASNVDGGVAWDALVQVGKG